MRDARIRGRRLQRIREHHFRLYPLCALCISQDPPRYSVATQLDHKVPLHKGGKEQASNRQGLCYDCHAAKTDDDLGRSSSMRVIGEDGFPIEKENKNHATGGCD